MRVILWGIMIVAMGCSGMAGEDADAGEPIDTESELVDAGADAAVDTDPVDSGVPDEEYCKSLAGDYKRCEGDLIVDGEDDAAAWEMVDCTHITGNVQISGYSGDANERVYLPNLACVDGSTGIQIAGGDIQYIVLVSLKRTSRLQVSNTYAFEDIVIGENFAQMPGEAWFWFESNDKFPTCKAVALYEQMLAGVGCIDVVRITEQLSDGCQAEAGEIDGHYECP